MTEYHAGADAGGRYIDGKWVKDGEGDGHWEDGKWVPIPPKGQNSEDGRWVDGKWVPYETKDGKKGYWKDGKWIEADDGKEDKSFGARPGQSLIAMGLGLAAFIVVM